MIEIMNDLPPHVAAFKASGKVTRSDYENVLMPHVDKTGKAFRKISFLLELDTNVGKYTIGAWADDLLVGIKHISQWHRVAIVSDQNAVKKITDIFGHLVPGEYKGFAIAELEAAKTWVSQI